MGSTTPPWQCSASEDTHNFSNRRKEIEANRFLTAIISYLLKMYVSTFKFSNLPLPLIYATMIQNTDGESWISDKDGRD